MIRFNVKAGVLTPVLPADATEDEKAVAGQIAQRFNGIQAGDTNYKQLMESLDQSLQGNYTNPNDYIDQQTVQELENFYATASGISQWDPTKQGADLSTFDAKFYSKQVPDEVASWNNASTSVSFGGQKIADVDITKKYADLDSFLHANYTLVGAPSGRLGKPRDLEVYTEVGRAPTDRERQILRETITGTSEARPDSLAALATQSLVDKQGEQAFGALSADVLKQTLNEYSKALKKEQMANIFQGMGMPSVNSLKQDIKNSILGDSGFGGFLGFNAGSDVEKGLSATLDRSLGIGSSVAYNWQDWFDKTLTERYRNMSEITNPEDANIKYKLEQEFVNGFINDYLKPRFDTSKSISEFVSYIDVTKDEQNALQTQLASSALKDYANKQANTYIDSLGSNQVTRGFDANFYFNPETITGTDVTAKQATYAEQKTAVDAAWNARNSDAAVIDGKSWSQLAYEYGLDLENKADFARLHYEVIGKGKGYDPAPDTYTRQDLAQYIQGDLATALEAQKASLPSPVFADFVSAEAKAADLVDKLNIAALPAELQDRLRGLGVNEKTDPAGEVKDALAQILRTDPALQIREDIRQLNEQKIKPTQEQLGYGYIQRDTDEQVAAPAGGSALYKVFKNAGFGGSEADFYKEFLPDATEEDKSLSAIDVGQATSSKGLTGLLGFELPDFSDPFAAMSSIDRALGSDTDVPKLGKTPSQLRLKYFDMFGDEEDENAPSYFNMSRGGGFGSLFG